MRKILTLLMLSLLLSSVFGFVYAESITAERLDIFSDLDPGESVVEYADSSCRITGISDGLKEGEEVVEFGRAVFVRNRFGATWCGRMLSWMSMMKENGHHDPMERSPHWLIVGKNDEGQEYSAWRSAGISATSKGTISYSASVTKSNSYSGSLQVSRNALNLYVGFDTSEDVTKTVGFTSELLDPAPGYGYRIEMRDCYDVYEVVQHLKYAKNGKALDEKSVYPKEFAEVQFRVVKFKVNN